MSNSKVTPSYQTEIQSMMFTFGEVRYPLSVTTLLVEEYLHNHAVDLLSNSAEISLIRGSKSISPEDLIFTVRHDRAKVIRLKEFLSWKEIRKNVKPDSTDNAFDDEPAGMPEGKEIPRKKSIHFQWEFPKCLTNVCDSEQSEDEDDLAEFHQEFRDRLEVGFCCFSQEADLITRKMTKEEYIEFAECRQASFTYKKTKKFKDWLGFSERYKPSDDLLEIIGFLLWEFLRKLTIEALSIRNRKQGNGLKDTTINQTDEFFNSFDTELQKLKAKSLFYAPTEKCALTPDLLREAFFSITRKDQKD